ncbi:MAG: TetR/AcrR family transcriptional regulator [Tannerella sp.]|jgi:AcrR family transcriptional regulator|nr:TetR/AcrR family transcriptional regulator [Tannerella sp.]
MRVLKDNKYNSILQTARIEFINNGYKDTSMRIIAQKADVGLSNIYNYFKNKDDIYIAIVGPVRTELFTFVTQQHTEEKINHESIATFGHTEDAIEYYIGLIDKYREELRLLLYHSQGSSMENFRDEFTEHLTNISYEYMKFEKKHYPSAKTISHFFIHTLSAWMVSILGEIVTHNLSKPKIREFFQEFFQFEFAGWRGLTGV